MLYNRPENYFSNYFSNMTFLICAMQQITANVWSYAMIALQKLCARRILSNINIRVNENIY